jgi:hypothetical protein
MTMIHFGLWRCERSATRRGITEVERAASQLESGLKSILAGEEDAQAED